MSQAIGSPRPAVQPTRTKPRPSTPSTRPRTSTSSRPSPTGTGGPSGATSGASKTGSSTPRPTSTTPSKPRPTKPRPTKPGASRPAKASATRPAKSRSARPTSTKPGAATPTKARPLSATARELQDVADRTRDSARTWDPASDDLTTAKNAHHSNTPEEMREALEGDHNWLEGDLRVRDDGELVMAHDAEKEGDGLTLDEWLAIGGAGERGLKIDVKESEAIPELLDRLEAADIPDGRLMLNVSTSQVDADDVRAMRERFPDAWFALNPNPGDDNDYGPDDLRKVTDLADAAGGRVAFPLRWDLVTDEVIETLKPHGKVSIWTARTQGTPDDTAGETQRLRERGVDGVIDLGPPQSFVENLSELGLDIWESGPVRGARDGVGWLGDRGRDLLDLGSSFLDGVRSLPGRFLDGARSLPGTIIDGATSLPGTIIDGAGSLAEGALDLGGDALDLGGDLLDGAGNVLSNAPLVGGLFGG